MYLRSQLSDQSTGRFCTWPGTCGSLSELCAVFSTSVALVRLSPVTGLSDHCLSHESLAVIHVDAFQTAWITQMLAQVN